MAPDNVRIAVTRRSKLVAWMTVLGPAVFCMATKIGLLVTGPVSAIMGQAKSNGKTMIMSPFRLHIVLGISFGFMTGIASHSIVQGNELPDVVSFNQHIRPIMSNTCFACHGPDESANSSGLRLDSYQAAVEEAEAIEPGKPDQSLVFQRIMDSDEPMPPTDFRHQLTDYEKSIFKLWIEQGAKYEKHWSYAKINRPAVPKLKKHADKIINPIDAFVLAKLEAEAIAPTDVADRRTLLRRLSLDLIGLPPTLQEIRDFEADSSPDAYEKQVDRLMASPHYGERMAARWLDIVRFSDTVGFHGDQNQRIFPYRDFVIQSINENQPFDEFTRDQLAGDLVENPTETQLVATGLIRLNMMTREGGAQPEEYLAKYAADRVRMIGTAWLGSTLGCCECHDHKYDPFSIKDFYSLSAFFDDLKQWGVYSDYGYTPNKDLRGYTNDHPFPPELRTESKSLIQEIQFLENQLDKECARQIADTVTTSQPFKDWLISLQSEQNDAGIRWRTVKPSKVTASKKGTENELLKDNSIRLSGAPVGGQQIELQYDAEDETTVRCVQIEALPDPNNGGMVGRNSDGKFNVEFSLTHHPLEKLQQPPIPVEPRFVRIELPGNRKILSLAEVQIFSKQPDGELNNIALTGTAKQSSTDHNGSAERAIDDDTSGDHGKQHAVTHTKTENNPWWEVDLGTPQKIDSVVIWNRTDGGLGKRLQGYRLVLLDNDRNPILSRSLKLPKPKFDFAVPATILAIDLIPAKQIAFGQADRVAPTRYRGGRPSPFLESVWRSGPRRWQLPANENNLKHTAVYHLERPLKVKKGDRLLFGIRSGDIGRFKISMTANPRFVVGDTARPAAFELAIKKIAEGSSFDALSIDEKQSLKAAFYRFKTPYQNFTTRIKQLRDDIARRHSGFAMTMVTQQTSADKFRVTRVLNRGDWKDESGEVVLPNTPRSLPKLADDVGRADRLDLANWITSDQNPLTPRHFVNRTWKHFFGTGLSNVLDDLGNQGEWPSHPKLLDWLASEFRTDWDRKKITRLIVTSRTYRQRASVRPELIEKDPHNRLLAQQSARRLEAEIVRDNALSISGLLNRDWIGGRSVFPYQPPGYYSNLQFPNRRYGTETNGLQYRRGIYMHWQRTFLHPMLTNFDAPSRDECVADRTLSNSPQQALTLLNDPVFVEAARAFAFRLKMLQRSRSFDSALDNAFELSVARPPTESEREALQKLYEQQLDYFRSHPDEAKQFNSVGNFRPPIEVDDAELAAASQVCRVILNLHETITRF